jgi:hypothetical protein
MTTMVMSIFKLIIALLLSIGVYHFHSVLTSETLYLQPEDFDEFLVPSTKGIRTDDAASNEGLVENQLRPTFSSLHNFLQEGRRVRPFEAGKSQLEILQSGINITDSKYSVPFFKPKGTYYAAAWLCSIQTFMQNQRLHLERKPLNFNPILEDGTWIGIRGQQNFRTVDMLDFFVHHLSRYKGPTGASNVSPYYEKNWARHLKRLDEMQQTHERIPFNNPKNERNGKVLAITPFHAATDRHSGEDEKQLSLNVTVKALARIFPNIVITVCDQVNYNYIINESGLNEYIYDVLLVKNLTMGQLTICRHLPALSSIQTREQVLLGRYSGFEWVYFTESDQPPHLRNLDALLRQTLFDNKTVVVPHRSYPVVLPEDVNITEASPKAQHLMSITGKKVLHDVPDLRDRGCCHNPATWNNTPWADAEIEIFRQHNSHAQAAGFCNPFKLTCSSCEFIDRTNGPCPAIP